MSLHIDFSSVLENDFKFDSDKKFASQYIKLDYYKSGGRFEYDVHLANNYVAFRQILHKNSADDISFAELNRHEYLQIRLSYLDVITRELLVFDKYELINALLKRYQEIVGYHNKFRNLEAIKTAYKSYVSLIEEEYSFLQEPLMSGYAFLPDNVKNTLKGKTALDFGGCNGIGALMFSEFLRQVCVFEPMSHFSNMVQNINTYAKKDNIKPYKLGVGAKSEVLKFYEADKLDHCRVATADDLLNYPDKIVDLNVVAIDDFVKQENIDDLGLMKFDIEGIEYDAIQGGLETIKKYKPVLLISIYHNVRDFFEIIKVIDSLNLGYKFMVRSLLADDRVWWSLLYSDEFVLVCWCD